MNKKFALLHSGVSRRTYVLLLVAATLINSCAVTPVEASGRKRILITEQDAAHTNKQIYYAWRKRPFIELYPASPHASAGWNSEWNLFVELAKITQTDHENPVELYVTGAILNGADEWMKKHIEATTLAFNSVHRKLRDTENTDCADALKLLLEAIKNGRPSWGDRLQCAATLNNAANCAYYDGDIQEALRLYKQALATAAEDAQADDSPIKLAIVRNLWHAHLKTGDPVNAQSCATYVQARELEVEPSRMPFYRGLAWVVTASSQVEYTPDCLTQSPSMVDEKLNSFLPQNPDLSGPSAYLSPEEKRLMKGKIRAIPGWTTW